MPARRITFFEAKTAAAFCLFAQHPADVLLLEVGLGGRLDATNVVDAPLATVIAPISMDHTEFLGDTLTAIAGEKAAIIKRDVPVISRRAAAGGDGRDRAAGAARMRAPLHAAGQQWHVGVERGRLVYQDDRGLMDLAAPKLFGRHQFDNAGLAIATLRAIETLQDRASRIRGRYRQCRMAGADAAAVVAARCWSRRRRAPRSGSTAGTMPKAGASPRRRWAISRSGYRVRWS